MPLLVWIDQALRVMQADADIDREYQSATRTLMTYMIEDPRHISRVINVLWVLRSLERIGDHARNISNRLFIWSRAWMYGIAVLKKLNKNFSVKQT